MKDKPHKELGNFLSKRLCGGGGGEEAGLEVTGFSALGTAAKHLLSHCNCFRCQVVVHFVRPYFSPSIPLPLFRIPAPFFAFIFSSIFLSRISFVRLLSFGFSRSFVCPENGLGLSSSVRLPVRLFVCLFVCLSLCLSVCCSVCLRCLLPMQARGANTCVNMRLCPPTRPSTPQPPSTSQPCDPLSLPPSLLLCPSTL